MTEDRTLQEVRESVMRTLAESEAYSVRQQLAKANEEYRQQKEAQGLLQYAVPGTSPEGR